MRKKTLPKNVGTCLCAVILVAMSFSTARAQSCPGISTTTITSYGNTYYPGSGTVAAGATSITVGAAGYGTTPISANDIVLIIQMQGTLITSTNNASYGAGTGTGNGYLNNASLLAGQMEYAVATNAVPLTGGTLNLSSGLTNSYKTAAYVAGTSGQYTFQVIRIPLYYNLTLGATINPPAWNGSVGGVLDLYVSNNLNMNGQTIDASSLGFRGGGGKNYSNVGAGSNTDFRNVSTNKAGGSKGEGIAGTPIYLYSFNAGALTVGAVEGYPNGSYDRGAAGNAGGGATDGQPTSNSNNAGGGGGGNGGTGGGGGNSWSSNLAVGGRGGALFGQQSPARLVMGGGGGAGSTDGGTGTPANGLASSGAPGGGIVLVTAATIIGTGSILANGAPPNTTLLNDGSGGGGAGGSILITTGSTAPGLTVSANGSAGASNTGAGADHGPGGGGAGGIVYSNKTLGTVSITGGAAGVTAGGVNYGATAGGAGISSQSITISSTPPFPIVCNVVLALGSIDATVVNINGNMLIRWQTETNQQIQGFDIERSTDSAGFSTIATVGAENDSYTDVSPGNHPLFYRIRETDIDGNHLYSNIVAIQPAVRQAMLTIAPNPTAGQTTLRFISDRNTAVSIGLFDLTGNRVWGTLFQATSGMNTLPIAPSQQLPDGMYIVQLNNGDKSESLKLFIRR